MNTPQAVSWSFLNEMTDQSVDGLNFAQARFVASLIPAASMFAWLVWHEGLDEWKTFEECKEIFLTSDHVHHHEGNESGVELTPGIHPPLAPNPNHPPHTHSPEPAAPGSRPRHAVPTAAPQTHYATASEVEEPLEDIKDFAANRLTPSVKREVDKRLQKRFVKYFKVEIKLKDRVFVTRTENISMGGMIVKDFLPEELGKSFEVTLLRDHGPKIVIVCGLIRSPDGKSVNHRRMRFIGILQEGLLHSWLLEPSAR